MKKRIFLKKSGVLALALLAGPLLGGASVAQAADIYIQGGGGGGGGGNNTITGDDRTGTGGGGGGAGGNISDTNMNTGSYKGGDGGTMPSQSVDVPGGHPNAQPAANAGTGGTYGNNTGVTDGNANGTAGTGGNANGTGTTSGSGGTAGSVGGHGGTGGNADATTTNMGGVGTTDSVYIHGGNSGQGGAGRDYGNDTGVNGGNGGAGGHASLNWIAGDQTISNLEVIAGATRGGQLGWIDDASQGCTDSPYCRYSSGSGAGGYASFTLDGILTANGANGVKVQANGNYAEFISNGLIARNGATTVTATNSRATMDIHGDASLQTLGVVSGGAGLARFKADGTVDTSGAIKITANSIGNATYESNDLTAGGATTVETTYAGIATTTGGNATMAVHGNADLQALTVRTTGTTDGGNASFKADGTGKVTTTGNVLVQSTGTGNASFDSVQYFGGGTTTVDTTGSGNANMVISGFQNSVSSQDTMTIASHGAGNASFSAPNAGTVKVASGDLNVTASDSGQASFNAPVATVAVHSGNLNVTSSASNAAGTATFLSRGLNIGNTTQIQSGAAAANATVTGTQVTTGTLVVAADGLGAADFIANTTTLLNTNAITVNGTGAGDAKITALNAQIDTSNDDVTIDATGGGTKGIYATGLETGNQQDPAYQINNGMVTMTSTGSAAGTAQLVLTDSLQTRELNLTGNGTPGSVNTNINKVDVTFIDTTFNFTDTTGSTDQGQSGVYFKTVSLGATDAVRTLNAANASLGTYWADTLAVNVNNNPGLSQNWVGNIWLGGHPGAPGVATGTVGTVDMILPANANLAAYRGNGSGANPNYMLKVDGQMTLTDGAAVNLRATEGNPFAGLRLNDQLQLVNTSQQVIDNTTQGVPVNGYSSLGAKDYFFNLQVAENGHDLLANYIWSNPNVAKAYLEGNIAALGNLYQGTELESRVIRNTFDPYVQGGLFQDGAKWGVMFGAEYSNLRLDSGSHVDSDYYNLVVGPAMRTETSFGRLGVAVFFETGHGDYSSYNSFPGLNVDGDGNTDYYGGGIGLRGDFSNGLYVDLSVRGGTVSTDQTLKNRVRAHYDDDTTYVGGHAGVGKIFDFAKQGRLDIYGGLLWTRLSGYSTTTDAGEHLDFDDADSLRSQIGGRYHYRFCQMATGYVGAAWEYEFDGDVGGSLDGVAIDEPSLQGSTGKGELGVTLNPADRLSIDLGVQGYTGEREGVGVTAALSFTF